MILQQGATAEFLLVAWGWPLELQKRLGPRVGPYSLF